MQVLHMGVLTKFFSALEKRGSLGFFCTYQTCALKKGRVFVLNKTQLRVPISAACSPYCRTRNF